MSDRAAHARLRAAGRSRPPSAGTTGASTTPRPGRARREALHAGADHLLQLRGRLRPAGLRRQGHAAGPQVRGQPAASRPRAAATAPRARPPSTRSTIPSASSTRCGARARAARGSWTRVTWDEVLDEIGGRIRKAFLEGRRNEVMYHVGPPGPRAHHGPRAQGLGHRRPQLPHQRLLGLGAARLRALERLRPAQPRPRERALHPAALVAPGVGPLLQPARAADHRGQAGGREAGRDGPAPLEHRLAWPTTGCRRTRAARPPCCWPWPA